MTQRNKIYLSEAEAAKQWDVSPKTVRRWRESGLLETVQFNQVTKTWEIEAGTLAPHQFQGKQHKTFTGRLAIILRALDKGQSIQPSRFNMDRAALQEHFLTLQEAGLIREVKNLPSDDREQLDLFRCYTPTTQGSQQLEGKRPLRQIASVLAPFIAAISEGTAKAYISKYISGA